MVKNPKNKRKSHRPSLAKKIILAGALTLFAGAAAWYTLSAYEERHTPSYQQLSSLEGVESIVDHKNDVPEVIVILQEHADESYSEQGVCSDIRSIETITRICDILYDKYGVRTLLPEGLDPDVEKAYEESKKTGEQIVFDVRDSGGYIDRLEELINGRKWILRSGENIENRIKIQNISSQLRAIYKRVSAEANDALSKVVEKYGDRSPIEGKFEIEEIMARANSNIRAQVNAVLTPEKTQEFYDLSITQRDEQYAQICRTAKQQKNTPIILIYGSAHYKTLPQHLNGMNYIIIRPSGIESLDPVTPESFKERHCWKLSVHEENKP